MMLEQLFLFTKSKEIIMNATALEREYTNNALTVLSEEEELFRASFREFAEGEVRPRLLFCEVLSLKKAGLSQLTF